MNTKTSPPDADPGVYATMSKKKLFQSSIHNLHIPADITSLQQGNVTSLTQLVYQSICLTGDEHLSCNTPVG